MASLAGQQPDSRIDFSAALAVADAALYEGYLLHASQASSTTQRVRSQYGVLAPRSWIGVANRRDEGVSGPVASWCSQTECLLEAPPDAWLALRLRFLQPIVDPGGPDADQQQAVRREGGLVARTGDLLPNGTQARVQVPGSAAEGRLTVRSERLASASPLYRLTVRVENITRGVTASVGRGEALRRSMVSTHVLLGVDRGGFLSMLDPPGWARKAAASCRNVRTFPVLAGPDGSPRVVLSAPTVLPDHPRMGLPVGDVCC